jgi:PAS domain S-box-containing protein
MLDFLSQLFDTSDFPPRWRCGRWTPGHGWLHILSDLGIWSAYFAIPCILAYFILRRRDTPFRLIFVLFGLFILACGTTHLLEALIFWWPAYRLAGAVKLLTALVSWGTVVALVRVTPRALAMRTPEELGREIEERKRVEAELRAAVEALRRSQAMFQGLFQFGPDAVLVTGPDGCIRQANFQAGRTFGHTREELVGQPVEVLIPERFHETHRRQRADYAFSPRARPMGEGRELYARRKDGSEFPVDIMLAPLQTPDGPLTLAAVRDISHRKANEEITRARARQQAALAEFGQRALSSSDTTRLPDEAVAVVARTLGVDLCRVLELLPGSRQLVLRAGWGWKTEHIGRATFETGSASHAGFCLAAGQPTIVADLRTETRFTPEPLLLEHGAVSGATVVIRGKSGAYGTLGVHTTRPRQFTPEDLVFLHNFANMLAAVIDRTEAEGRVQASLAEKEVLLKEVHHRVKNNLQVICSLLDLQSSYARDDASAEMFRESMSRVRSMALVHERLYRSGNLARVDFAAYVEALAEHLFRAYQVDVQAVRLDIRAEANLGLPIDAAVPCGLLLNELLSNCLKHAFRGRDRGTVHVSLRQPDDNIELCVADDGVGLPADLEDFQRAETFGLQLVAMLADQLHATTAIQRQGGTAIRLTFPLARDGVANR